MTAKEEQTVRQVDPLVAHQGAWFFKFMFPTGKQFQAVRDFPLNDEDIMVVSFPKSGTTWLQQIVWLMLDGGDCSDKRSMIERFKYLEMDHTALDDIVKEKSPRLLKTHMPYGCLPSAVEAGFGKVIYIARNVKDVCVSYFHFHQMMPFLDFRGNFSEFHEMFLNGPLSYGLWLDHVGDFWNHRGDRNILFIFYEDLHQKGEETIRKVAKFIGCSVTDNQVADIVRQTAFSAMKAEPPLDSAFLADRGFSLPPVGLFMRKGIIGDWMNYYTDDMEAVVHQRCIEPLQRRGLQFDDRPQCVDTQF